jgi:hypothetical protein
MSQHDGNFIEVAREAAESAGSYLMENLGRLDPHRIEQKTASSPMSIGNRKK